MTPVVDIARRMMRSELKRYAVPPETHITIETVEPAWLEATADAIELRMARISGYGLDAVHDFAVFRLPGQLATRRVSHDLVRALLVGIAGMCKELFGVHDGEGLP